MNFEKIVTEAAQCLLKGDWGGDQRCLRSVPSKRETEFHRCVDTAMKSGARRAHG